MAVVYSPLTQALSYRGAILATGIGLSIWALGLLFGIFGDLKPYRYSVRKVEDS